MAERNGYTIVQIGLHGAVAVGHVLAAALHQAFGQDVFARRIKPEE